MTDPTDSPVPLTGEELRQLRLRKHKPTPSPKGPTRCKWAVRGCCGKPPECNLDGSPCPDPYDQECLENKINSASTPPS